MPPNDLSILFRDRLCVGLGGLEICICTVISGLGTRLRNAGLFSLCLANSYQFFDFPRLPSPLCPHHGEAPFHSTAGTAAELSLAVPKLCPLWHVCVPSLETSHSLGVTLGTCLWKES